jgi:hypothetical protein
LTIISPLEGKWHYQANNLFSSTCWPGTDEIDIPSIRLMLISIFLSYLVYVQINKIFTIELILIVKSS